MLDRTTPPPVREVETLTFPEVEASFLPNGIPLYVIDRGEQELSRVDILFSAGKVDETHPLTARHTVAMLREGAAGLSSAEIAEKLDYYGPPCRHWLHSAIPILRSMWPTVISSKCFPFCINWWPVPIFLKQSLPL